MIALFLSPLYILGNVYICFRTLQWLAVCSDQTRRIGFRLIFITLYVFLSCSIALAFILPHSSIQRIIANIHTFWFGILLYTILTLGIAELIRLILKFSKIVPADILASRRLFMLSGSVCMAVIIVLSLWGIYSATHVRDTCYEISIDKDGGKLDELDIALAADLHLGYTIGPDMMRQMVEKINAGQPDIILIAGDIFDNDYDAIEDPEKLISILSELQR